LEFAVHLGGRVKSILALLSVPNRPHFGRDLPVRRGSAGQGQVARKDKRAYVDVLFLLVEGQAIEHLLST
jgi:hypothetical protein